MPVSCAGPYFCPDSRRSEGYVLDREEHEIKKKGASGRKQETKDLGVKKHKRREPERWLVKENNEMLGFQWEQGGQVCVTGFMVPISVFQRHLLVHLFSIQQKVFHNLIP